MKFSDWNFRLRPRLEMGISEKKIISNFMLTKIPTILFKNNNLSDDSPFTGTFTKFHCVKAL